MQDQLRIVRVGGSLLTWDQLPAALDRWLGQQPPANNLLIAGGGPWVELLRNSATQFSIDDEAAHWICIQAMRTTAALLAEITQLPLHDLLPIGATPFGQSPHRAIVLDVYQLLRHAETTTDQTTGVPNLPPSWSVTSDSIAAWLALRSQAAELVLLKSAAPPSGSAAELADAGYVDAHFPVLSSGLNKLRLVNLPG